MATQNTAEQPLTHVNSLADLDRLSEDPDFKPEGSTPSEPSTELTDPATQPPAQEDPKKSDSTEKKDEPKKEEQEDSAEESTQEDDLDVGAFWSTVDQITGETVEVDFGEIDPISPQGVALREQKVREQASQKFEEYLKQKDPRGYAYLLHRDAGRPDEEFFSEKSFVLPDREEFEESVDKQSQLVKTALIHRGVPEELAQATVDKYIKDNLLKDKALGIYDEQRKVEQEQVKRIEAIQMEQQRLYKEEVDRVVGGITETINDGLKFIVPEAKKVEFNKFIKENLRYDNGRFYIVTELDRSFKNLKKVVESQFFQFMNNDLNSIVEKKSKTVATQRLRAAVKKDTALNSRGTNTESSKTEFVPLGDI